ncbi:hypothetical protein [Taibaiella soli]|nr:hypothetical protein [Taibaiella soli]
MIKCTNAFIIACLFVMTATAQEIPARINYGEKFAGKIYPHCFNYVAVTLKPVERTKNFVLKNDSLIIVQNTAPMYYDFHIKVKIKASHYTVKVLEKNKQIGVIILQMAPKPLEPRVYLTGTSGLDNSLNQMARQLTNLTCEETGYGRGYWKIVSYVATFVSGEKYYTVRMKGDDQFPEKAKEFYGTFTPLKGQVFIKDLVVMDDDSTVYNVGDYQVCPEVKKL